MEGVAFNSRWLLQPVEKFLGRKLERINFVGGGAKSDVWCKILADVLNLSIRQVKDPIQANARGAAFIAAVGLGYLEYNDIPELIEYNYIYRPDPASREVYDKMFDVFVKFYKNNKGLYQQLNS